MSARSCSSVICRHDRRRAQRVELVSRSSRPSCWSGCRPRSSHGDQR
jgi:hypothetical protein